ANGDLTKRLVVPALYNLSRSNLLPERFALIGVDHGDRSTETWKAALHDFLEQSVKSPDSEFEGKAIDTDAWRRVANAMRYVKGDFLDPKLYAALGDVLQKLDTQEKLGGAVLFYLAVADRFF